ncbi:hypothetical protein M758_10G050000 [Ceratodon purpureus]|nr:hypothetical protein M758_10G050000 [Ceratodon purpureus]
MVSFKAPTIKSCVTSLVSPELPTAPENLHLAFSPADLADLRIFTPVILLYETPVDSEFETLVGNLKDSLRKVLVEYYPLAGRIAKGENGVAELLCDDRGAYFTQMVVEETLEEFGGRDACFGIMGMGAANLKCEGFQVYTLNEYKEIPPLVIQVTLFKCKAIALAVNWHHQVADGVSGFSFLKAWSEVARGLPITSSPDHRRHLMSSRLPPHPLEGCPPEYRVLSAQPQEHHAQKSTQSRKKVEITISGEEIQQLKKQAAEGSDSGPFSSGVCISAHLWKLVTAARGLNRDDSTSIFSVLDGRTRMKDFPMNYFGNCIFVRKAVSSVGDIVDMPLCQVAKLIHDSIHGATDDYIRSVLDWFEVTGTQNIVHNRPSIGTHDLLPTFWRFFPIYELDFGFGKPTYGGRNSPPAGAAGFAAVSPTPSRDGSVLITVYLYPDAADALISELGLGC